MFYTYKYQQNIFKNSMSMLSEYLVKNTKHLYEKTVDTDFAVFILVEMRSVLPIELLRL